MTDREPWYVGAVLAATLVAVIVAAMVAVLEPGATVAYVLFWALVWSIVAGIPFTAGYYLRDGGHRVAGVVAYGVIAFLLWAMRPMAGDGSGGFLPGLAEALIWITWVASGGAAVVGAIAGSVASRLVFR